MQTDFNFDKFPMNIWIADIEKSTYFEIFLIFDVSHSFIPHFSIINFNWNSLRYNLHLLMCNYNNMEYVNYLLKGACKLFFKKFIHKNKVFSRNWFIISDYWKYHSFIRTILHQCLSELKWSEVHWRSIVWRWFIRFIARMKIFTGGSFRGISHDVFFDQHRSSLRIHLNIGRI